MTAAEFARTATDRHLSNPDVLETAAIAADAGLARRACTNGGGTAEEHRMLAQ